MCGMRHVSQKLCCSSWNHARNHLVIQPCHKTWTPGGQTQYKCFPKPWHFKCMNYMKIVIPLHFISWKKTPNDDVKPQRQSQFTPQMKAIAVPRLLSSLVWIDQYNECNGMTVSWNSCIVHMMHRGILMNQYTASSIFVQQGDGVSGACCQQFVSKNKRTFNKTAVDSAHLLYTQLGCCKLNNKNIWYIPST